MICEHLAIDGSVVTIEASADLSADVSATGWAIVPSLMRSHPFSSHPPGHTNIVEKTMSEQVPDLAIKSESSYSIKDGNLRVAEIELPRATGGLRTLTVGGWEGEKGSLTTSLSGHRAKELVAAFDTLRFHESARGVSIDSPVVAEPRAPEVLKEIPGLGVLKIRPAVKDVLDRIPRSRGFASSHGELFRIREGSRSLVVVGSSTVVNVNPPADADGQAMLALALGLKVDWTPRASAAA